MYLAKHQYLFLVELSKTDALKYNLISNTNKSVAQFFDDSGLARLKYEQLTRISETTHKPERYDGKIISVSITEAGKAYIAEVHHNIAIKIFRVIGTAFISAVTFVILHIFEIEEFIDWCIAYTK